MVVFLQCIDCKNYMDKNKENKFCCRAFPKGIPEDVFWNKKIHDEHLDGDNYIYYEPIIDVIPGI